MFCYSWINWSTINCGRPGHILYTYSYKVIEVFLLTPPPIQWQLTLWKAKRENKRYSLSATQLTDVLTVQNPAGSFQSGSSLDKLTRWVKKPRHCSGYWCFLSCGLKRTWSLVLALDSDKLLTPFSLLHKQGRRTSSSALKWINDV